jgi:branched-chain amino acid transport system substrate-binding protein
LRGLIALGLAASTALAWPAGAQTPGPVPRGIAVTPRAGSLYAQSWAVVIGINRFRDARIPSLQYALNDAQSVARALIPLGFPEKNITLLLNEQASRREVERILASVIRRATGPEDRLVVFFATHGVTTALPHGGEEGHILPYDADPDDLPLTALAMQQLKQMGQRIPAKHILVAVDACYGGFSLVRSQAPTTIDSRYLELVGRSRVIQVLTAGRKDQPVIEEQGHGVFTRKFLDALTGHADENRDGLITFAELGAWLHPRVAQASDFKQEVQWGSLEGEGQFVFVLPTALPGGAGGDPGRDALAAQRRRLEEERRQLAEEQRQLEEQRLAIEQSRLKEERDRVEAARRRLEEERQRLQVAAIPAVPEPRPPPAPSDQRVVKIGMSLPITGADADGADSIRRGAELAIQEINARGGAAGYKLEAVLYDSATRAAGQYDPAQATTNYRRFVADHLVLAAVGPVMSGEGKAISPIVSDADMATITPSSTNPDITDPKFQSQYRPQGKAVYFRNVTTDAFQGPGMANYLFHRLKTRSVYVLDDGGAFGVSIADSFERRAKELGMKVLGRDRLDRSLADYRTVLRRIGALKPDALYYGGVLPVAGKLAPQAHEVMPNVVKAGSDGIYDLSWPQQSGKEAVEGWYCSQASPELVTDPKVETWVTRFRTAMKREPTNYSITAYNAVYVIADAVERVARSGKALNRSHVRDAIQATRLTSIQGPIEYDENGDLRDRIVSVYQWRDGRVRYVGVAPQR